MIISRRYLVATVVCWLFWVAIASAVDSPSEAADKQIRRLREEIARIEAEITRAGKSEVTLQQRVSDLERKIALKEKLTDELNSLLKRYNRDLKVKTRRVDDLSQQLDYTTSRAQTVQKRVLQLREQARVQALQRYMYQRKPIWMYLLAGESLSEVLRKIRMYSFLQRCEHRVVAELSTEVKGYLNTQQDLSELHGQLAASVDAGRRKIKLTKQQQREAEAAQRQLASEREQQRNKLAQVHTDKAKLERDLQEQKAALDEIQRLIAKNIANRERWKSEQTNKESGGGKKSTTTEWHTPSGVATRGTLSWPSSGAVTTRFGWHQGGAYGTTTESPGIEIQAAPGTPARAAANGVVAEVTWLRGFGTTVILEHVDGTYTVYSRLGSSTVTPNTVVKRGQVLGAVAASNQDESTLHFEVWNRGKKQDPINWLERR